MSKCNEVKETLHLQQTMRRSQLPGCLPFFTKLCFGWFVVQHLFQSEFLASVYQAKQQKLSDSRIDAFSHQGKLRTVISWYHLIQFQFLVPRKLCTLKE